MQHAYRVHRQLVQDGTLTLDDLPFRTGDEVEVLVLARVHAEHGEASHPLRGHPVHLDAPFAPVANSDWQALG